MTNLGPAYIDITWGAGGSTADRTLDMSKTIQKYFGLDVMMHLTCTNMSIDLINSVLLEAKKYNIYNSFILRNTAATAAKLQKPIGFFTHLASWDLRQLEPL